MDNKKILELAIKKAVKNGYKGFEWDEDFNIETEVEWLEAVGPYDFIFSHPFAIAFFGKSENNPSCSECGSPYDGWQYHLQQMVLEKDPIKYLEQFL